MGLFDGFTRSYIKDEEGNTTAIRDTREDGRVSYVYEPTGNLAPFMPETGALIEKQIHDTDGTTRPAGPLD